jgi:alkanesulfonate monooxygenase SsuD/methylene tetrahydromethanopterin reductase-like flavin-dependent oxidoreductase (luciferase family)
LSSSFRSTTLTCGFRSIYTGSRSPSTCQRRNYQQDYGRLTVLELAENARWTEQLGFDGALIFEQHSHPIGLIGNATVGAAWLATATAGIRICAVGPILNSYATPIRLAEEIALVDNLSNGRLTVGLPMGIGAQYHAVGVMNPAQARARHREANELLVKALTPTDRCLGG